MLHILIHSAVLSSNPALTRNVPVSAWQCTLIDAGAAVFVSSCKCRAEFSPLKPKLHLRVDPKVPDSHSHQFTKTASY